MVILILQKDTAIGFDASKSGMGTIFKIVYTEFEDKIQRQLKINFDSVFLDADKVPEVLLSRVGFEQETANWLGSLIGEDDMKNPTIAWEWIHSFVQSRLNSLSNSLPGETNQFGVSLMFLNT